MGRNKKIFTKEVVFKEVEKFANDPKNNCNGNVEVAVGIINNITARNSGGQKALKLELADDKKSLKTSLRYCREDNKYHDTELFERGNGPLGIGSKLIKEDNEQQKLDLDSNQKRREAIYKELEEVHKAVKEDGANLERFLKVDGLMKELLEIDNK